MTMILDLPRHGVSTAYKQGCRCDDCTRDNRERVAEWRRRQPKRDRPEPKPVGNRTARPMPLGDEPIARPHGEIPLEALTIADFAKHRGYDPATRSYVRSVAAPRAITGNRDTARRSDEMDAPSTTRSSTTSPVCQQSPTTEVPMSNPPTPSPTPKEKKHRHNFHGMYWHFGQYGDQDVHMHPCDGTCGVELQGTGRLCDETSKHKRVKYSDRTDRWVNA